MSDPLRLVFMGSDPIALPLLDWLAGKGEGVARLAGVVTGPDRASGRGQEMRPNPVKSWTAARPLEVLQPEKLDAAFMERIAALRPDVVLVVAYGHILRDPLIALPRLGTLNLHASLLPKYRGASPIQSAVASGERMTAMALMRIVRELDAGPVADVEQVPIGRLDTALDVEQRLALAAIPLVERSLPRLARGELEFAAQDASKASFCRRLAKTDAVVDFTASAEVLAARINGLNPWPSVVAEILGVPVKLGQAEALYGSSFGCPGTVNLADSEGLLVMTGSGILRVRRLQRPGGKMLAAPEFQRGFPIPPHTVIPSRPMPELVSSAPFGR
jgi:methionyl-tRNA formyltransferase